MLVDVLAEDGGRLDDNALRRREGGQQAADDNGEIGRRVSGTYGGHQQGQAACALVHVGRRSRIDQLSDLIDGERRKRERYGAVPAEVGETDGGVLPRGRPHGTDDREAGAARDRCDVGEQVQGGSIGPVQVFEYHP